MANRELQGLSWDIPEELCNHLTRIKNSYKGDKNAPGYQRLENFIENPKMSYEQLKRVKNFFDTHSSSGTDYMDKKQDTEFILNGASKMKHFVNKTLEDARRNIENPKKVKNDTGMVGNHYQKNSFMNNIKKDVKISTKPKTLRQEGIYEIGIMENIINIFDKNKQLWQTDN